MSKDFLVEVISFPGENARVSCNSVGHGVEAASLFSPLNLDPSTAMRLFVATGCSRFRLAKLTTPPVSISGCSRFSTTPPVIGMRASRLGTSDCTFATMATFDARTVRAVQAPVHRPLPHSRELQRRIVGREADRDSPVIHRIPAVVCADDLNSFRPSCRRDAGRIGTLCAGGVGHGSRTAMQRARRRSPNGARCLACIGSGDFSSGHYGGALVLGVPKATWTHGGTA